MVFFVVDYLPETSLIPGTRAGAPISGRMLRNTRRTRPRDSGRAGSGCFSQGRRRPPGRACSPAPGHDKVGDTAVFLLWMRDNTQRAGNGRLAYGNQIYERIMPANSDMGGLQVKS
jgi:hypothetical protein